jgi:capsular polysaccharide biosynthesis protein
MNEQQEVREISLVDLMFYCLERWRCILVIMLIAGILAGAYKYQSVVRSNRSVKQEASLDSEDEEGEEETDTLTINERSVEAYEQIIARCRKDVEAQENFLNQSIVMEIDPFHVSTGTLSYYVDGGERLDSLVAAYRTFVTDGSMAEKLHAKNKAVSVEDLRYLVSFNSSDREAYRLGDYEMMRPEKLVIQILVNMPDEKLCGEYLSEAEKVMKDYSAKLEKSVGAHRLNLLSSVQSEKADSNIQSYQATLRSGYVEAVRNLQLYQTEMNTVLSLETEETGSASGSAGSAAVLASPSREALKYALIGVVLGAFLACFVLMMIYIMSGRLRNTKTFAGEYGMPMLGLVRSSDKKRAFGLIDAWIFRLEEGAYARLGGEDQVKIAAANVQAAVRKLADRQDGKKIMLAGTVAKGEIAGLCEKLTSYVPEVSWSPYVQIVFQADAINELEDYDGVLFVEKRGVSDSRFIVKERKIAEERGVPVLGSVIGC